MAKPEQRNLLFITFDQLRADVVMGRLAGIAPTPNLDRLRREGVSFANCHTATVPCGPSRASLLTGLYAFNHRSIRNGTPLARHHATLATELRKLGREPLLFGYNDVTADPTGRDLHDPDFATYELPARGFREVVEMRMESAYNWIGHLRARGYELPGKMPGNWFSLYKPVAADGAGPQIDDPLMMRAEDSETAYLTDRVIEALNARRDGVWSAHVAYIRPHPPLGAPEPYNRLVGPEQMPAPVAAGNEVHPFREAWFSQLAGLGLWWGFDGKCAEMTPATAQALRAVYLGLVAEVDFHLGRILDWLDDTGQAERTVVMVVSDHGEMLGDQGYWGKDNVLRPAHHVPMILRGPGIRAGARVDDMVSTVDVTPTLLDLMGAVPPPAMDGISLRPALEPGGAGVAGRDALTEIDLGAPDHATRFQASMGLDEVSANAAVLRDGRWSMVHFNGGIEPMLFDRANDPDECHNLSAEAAAQGQMSRMRARMLDLRMSRADRRLTGFSFGA